MMSHDAMTSEDNTEAVQDSSSMLDASLHFVCTDLHHRVP